MSQVVIGGGNFNVGLEALRLAAEQRAFLLQQQALANQRNESQDRAMQVASQNKAAIDAKRIEQQMAMQHLAATQQQAQQFHADQVAHEQEALRQAAQQRADAIAARHEDLQDRLAARADQNAQSDTRMRFIAEQNNAERKERERLALEAKQDMLAQRLAMQQQLAGAKQKQSIYDFGAESDSDIPKSPDAVLPGPDDTPVTPSADDAMTPTPTFDATPSDDTPIPTGDESNDNTQPAALPKWTPPSNEPPSDDQSAPDVLPGPDDTPPLIEPGTPDLNDAGPQGMPGPSSPTPVTPSDDDVMASIGSDVAKTPTITKPTAPTISAANTDFVPPSSKLPPLPPVEKVPPALMAQYVQAMEHRERMDRLAQTAHDAEQARREKAAKAQEDAQAKAALVNGSAVKTDQLAQAAAASGQNPHDIIEAAKAHVLGVLPRDFKKNPILKAEVDEIETEFNEKAAKAIKQGNIMYVPPEAYDVWHKRNANAPGSPAHRVAAAAAVDALHDKYSTWTPPVQPPQPPPPLPKTTTAASGATPTSVNTVNPTPEEYKALPSGTTYTFNGKTFVKK